MSTFENLSNSARLHSVYLTCPCGHHAPAGICDDEPTLPVICEQCAQPLDAASVLLANLLAARAEITQLASVVGSLLASIGYAIEKHPHVKHKPVETLRRAMEAVSIDANSLPVAALQDAIFRRSS